MNQSLLLYKATFLSARAATVKEIDKNVYVWVGARVGTGKNKVKQARFFFLFYLVSYCC
jgi:hypothetical protein